MRILFDHGTPSRIAGGLVDHAITEAIDRGWDRISNGELLKLAEEAGFELLLTTDKNLVYQQNLSNRRMSIVVLGNSTWRYVRPHLDRVLLAVNAATPAAMPRWKFHFLPKSRSRRVSSRSSQTLSQPLSYPGDLQTGNF